MGHRITLAPRAPKTEMSPTQRLLMQWAKHYGVIQMGLPDRRGTRLVGYSIDSNYLGKEERRVPIIRAYMTPEWFLVKKGWLNDIGQCRFEITEAGKVALDDHLRK